jgi:AraC-like DNA-binding protein
VDQAVATVAELYGPHALILKPGRAGLNMHFASFEVGKLSISSVEYGCPAIGRQEQSNDYWMFSYLARGGATMDGEPVRATAACVRAPGTLIDISMSEDVSIVNLIVQEDALRAAHAILYGDIPDEKLQFGKRFQPGSDSAVKFADVLQRLHQLPSSPAAFGAMLERRWQEAALLELLLALPHASASRFAGGAASRCAVDRAIDLMNADPAASVALSELARAAGVGVRALTRAFERRLGISPMRYLQQMRLERVRNDLLDGQSSVTEIAFRWGFGNLGDFAMQYKARYGERPSETLRRTRA